MKRTTGLICVVITVLATSGLFAQPYDVSLKAFLEGPYGGTEMGTWLNSGNHLPLQQPYNSAPWYYAGGESVAAIPNADVVDWVLVEFRETPGDATTAYRDNIIATMAAFLLKNGDIVSVDGVSPIQISCPVNYNLFAVIYHRNHLAVMSGSELLLDGNLYSYDFTTAAGQAYGGVTAHKQIAAGIWGLTSGDGNGDGQVNNVDKNEVWVIQAGLSGYLEGDFDMNSQVNNIDKIDHWVINSGRSSQSVGAWACGNVIHDIEGNLYNTVLIGSQCWMKENMNTGTMISGSSPQTGNGIIEKYCYADDPANCAVYGGLYQWDEMMQYGTGSQGICPDGWRLPDDDDWCTLEQFVDPSITCGSTGWRGIDGGGRLKEAGTAHWADPNTGATNSSDFTGLPGGYRSTTGGFIGLSGVGNFWSSSIASMSNAWYRGLGFNLATIFHASDDKGYAWSVRCLRDEAPVNQPPDPPSDPTPPDNATAQPLNTQLSWSCTDPENDPLTYDVYFGIVDPPGLVVSGQSDTIYNPGTLGYGTQYFWKIAAHDDHGNSTEGVVWGFSTQNDPPVWSCGQPITDIDGNTYNTVLIGGQCWMKENLQTTTYRNGVAIPNVTTSWNNLSTGAYVWYENDPTWKDKYGALYNWYAVNDTRGLCPEGWHVPTESEWNVLTDFIGGTSSPNGNKLKSCRQAYSPLGGSCHTFEHPRWDEDTNYGNFGTDDYGFAGLPGGYRPYNAPFLGMGQIAGWWHSTGYSSYMSGTRSLNYNNGIVTGGGNVMTNGFSVRCLRY
ncbi:MAG: hypothetical protein JXA03_00795 [Bacteroidales bacterium]|nr:hypothetical protein [Bacteroidales bacterium]